MPASRTESLSAAEARRVALAAQGFSGSRKLRARRPFDSALERLHVLQIDAINVFARSHYLPVFSRHGGYDQVALDRLLLDSGDFTEYWAHEASFIPVADRPLFAWRMAALRDRDRHSGRAERFAETIAQVRATLTDSGPQLARDLGDGTRRGSGNAWGNRTDAKHALEMLFAWGEVASAGRSGFQRRYGLAEQVLPASALDIVPRGEAEQRLVERAALSLGVATLADLADYHRLKTAVAAPAVQALVEQGILVPVSVEGWTDPAWLHRDARVPARLAPNALVTPFDPIVWYRPRTERLFDFHYRIEVYTPREKRQFGYYCLPLLVRGRLAGRIDLKADRAGKTLLVQAAWQEAGAPAETGEVATELLAEAAAWQGLESISVSSVGNLAVG